MPPREIIQLGLLPVAHDPLRQPCPVRTRLINGVDSLSGMTPPTHRLVLGTHCPHLTTSVFSRATGTVRFWPKSFMGLCTRGMLSHTLARQLLGNGLWPRSQVGPLSAYGEKLCLQTQCFCKQSSLCSGQQHS